MEQKTKITIEHYGTTFSVEFPNGDVTINQMLEAFKGLLISDGFQYASWEAAIMDEISGHMPEDEEIDPELSMLLDKIYSRYKDN
jgi:hypothetical protein